MCMYYWLVAILLKGSARHSLGGSAIYADLKGQDV